MNSIKLIFILLLICQESISQKKSFKIHLNINDSTLTNKIIGKTFVYASYKDGRSISIPIDTNFNFNVKEIDLSIFHPRIENRYEKIDTCGNYIFYFHGYPEIDLAHYTPNGEDTIISIDYPLECHSALNPCDNVCPNCKRSDKVRPVRYGLPTENPITGELGESEYYYPGCDFLFCNSNWYCERDKLLF